MGWIQSAIDPTEKATFGFVFAFDGTTYSFSGAYHDKAAGVDFKGSGVLKEKSPPAGMRSDALCLAGMPAYVSTSRDFPGEGFLELTVCDLDRGGPSVGDFILVNVLTGPFGALGAFAPGYTNFGFPSGNITVTCSGDCVP